ncbi:glutathione S-transferase family protein [Paucibacter sp. O1-1]|nr:glutathione S-transferase family protein [Paucibacter sp. O1-1]MDA3829322.1 glutathione S-transferase family protein [Paucibacter sp. O1-1]
MTPVLFYGVPSGCSFGSIVALEWLAQPYRLSRIEMPELAITPAYRRINPLGETPTLMTADGALLSESLAILNHLGARDEARRIGFAQGSRDFDRLNQMLAYLNTSFFNAFSPLWHALEHAGDAADAAALRRYGAGNVEKVHAQLEAMLGDRPYLLGEHKTLADAYFIGIARWTRYHEVIDRRDYPALQRLYERLEADPAVVFAHAIERQTAAVTAGGYQGHLSLEQAVAALPVR